MADQRVLGSLVACVITFGCYALMPTPGGGLHENFPHAKTLEKYQGVGCGQSGMDATSSTTFYTRLSLDPKERLALHDEMVSQGYLYEKTPLGDHYTRVHGFVFPIHSAVRVGASYVVASACRYKMPFR